MRHSRAVGLTLLALAGCGSPEGGSAPTVAPAASTANPAVAMSLTSSDIHEGGAIAAAHVYSGNGCGGGNLSPALAWSGAPPSTRSYALTVHDPDAARAGGFWHWVVFDIPATTTSLPRGAGSAGSSAMPPAARQGRNDFGDTAYDGPCPPAGSAPHHYAFTLSALDVDSLELPAGSSPAQVDFQVHAHTLASAVLTALHGR